MPETPDDRTVNHVGEGLSDSSQGVSTESSIETTANPAEERIREDVRRETEMRLLYYSQAGTEAIDERLDQLDTEWGIERAFQAGAAGLALFGLTFGALFNRKWFVFPALAAGCLLQQSTRGWSPPMALLRKLGVRTTAEIDFERYGLKALRGDFREIESADKPGPQDLAKVLEAVER